MKEDKQKNNYDLEERTAKFAESIVEICKKIPQNTINTPIISQLTRAGTSVGANYCEANGASSKSDFRNKIYICKKEIKETKYWLRILAKAINTPNEIMRNAYKEARELTLIFSKIASSTKIKN
jgi:four helix bundle protein